MNTKAADVAGKRDVGTKEFERRDKGWYVPSVMQKALRPQ